MLPNPFKDHCLQALGRPGVQSALCRGGPSPFHAVVPWHFLSVTPSLFARDVILQQQEKGSKCKACLASLYGASLYTCLTARQYPFP